MDEGWMEGVTRQVCGGGTGALPRITSRKEGGQL